MRKSIIFLLIFAAFAVFGNTFVNLSPYSKKVKRTGGGNVYLRIDTEKQKGESCNTTSMSMILDYFGVYVSAKKLQKDSENSDAHKYSAYLAGQLAKYNMKMYPVPMIPGREKEVFEVVKRAIDCGLPLQWLVDLLKAPDYDINKKQKRYIIKNGGNGGHARVFNGYKINRKKNEIEHFIFTDSWGIHHKKKEIKPHDITDMTYGFYIIVPEKFPQKIINYIYAPLSFQVKERGQRKLFSLFSF